MLLFQVLSSQTVWFDIAWVNTKGVWLLCESDTRAPQRKVASGVKIKFSTCGGDLHVIISCCLERPGGLGVSCWTELQYQPKKHHHRRGAWISRSRLWRLLHNHPQHVGRAACGVSEPLCIPAHMQTFARTTLTPPARHWSHMLFWT